MLENYARYINVLIFGSAHQEHNEALTKLCNLVHLLTRDARAPERPARRVDLSQEELAELLAMNRVSVAKLLARLHNEGAVVSHRGWLEVVDEDALLVHCSYEVVGEKRLG